MIGNLYRALWLSLFVFVLPPTNQSEAQTYTVRALPLASGAVGNLANAINNQGVVVGSSSFLMEVTPGEFAPFFRAAKWEGESFTDLGQFAAQYTSTAADISDSGFIVGEALVFGLGRVAVAWGENNSPVLVDGFEFSFFDSAWAVNNEGYIVGQSNSFLESGGPRDKAMLVTPEPTLINLDPSSSFDSVAKGINDARQIVGFRYDSSGGGGAFIWNKGVLTALPQLPGHLTSVAEKISASAQVVGYSISLDIGKTRAVMWDQDRPINLGTIGDNNDSYGWAINNAGQVVGNVEIAGGSRAFIWTAETGMIDLNTLIPPGSGWVLLSALDINDRGEIVGYGSFGGQARAFVLTPI